MNKFGLASAGLAIAFLLFAAHANAQTGNATRSAALPAQPKALPINTNAPAQSSQQPKALPLSAAQPVQPNPQAKFIQPSSVYPAKGGFYPATPAAVNPASKAVTYSGQTMAYPGQGVSYPGQVFTYPGPSVFYPGSKAVYTGTQTQGQGYAVAPSTQFQSVGGQNGYAVASSSQFQTAGGANGYAAPVTTADPYVLCDAKWSAALRREVMNPDDWICSTRTNPLDGTSQLCIITGPTSASVFKNISDCGWKMPTFCDNTVADLMASLNKPASTSATTIPSDYSLIAGTGYFKLHTEKLTWDAAKLACEAEAPGAHLAIPSNAADYVALNDMLNAAVPGQTAGAFIGINDIAVEGQFVSVTGQPICMIGQIMFQTGQPDNFGNEDCLQVGWSGVAFVNDIPCSLPLPFICELPLPGTTIVC